MDKAFTTTFAPSPIPRKASARAALDGFHEPHQTLLSDCFRQFGIAAIAIYEDAADRLRKEKFEACVLGLTKGDEAEAVMEAARGSRSNSRCVKYGVNAMFHEPLERPAMLKLVRATRLLVLHEFRRYVRIPVITEVSIIGEGRRSTATSVEMSSGGMSLKGVDAFSPGANVEISFALMTLPRVNLRGVVSWNKPKSLGVRFDPNDQRRLKLKTWIDSYLEN